MSAVLITLPCTARQLEAALHSYCDHHGAWDMRIMSDAISSGRSIQDTRITLALSEGSGESSPSPSSPTSSAPTDSAAIREALESILNLAYEVNDANADGGCRTNIPTEFVIDTIKNALAKPARNCDVGTLTEQQQRFHDFCEKMQHTDKACCGGCPIVHLRMQGVINNSCELAWAQMPYKEGETDGK